MGVRLLQGFVCFYLEIHDLLQGLGPLCGAYPPLVDLRLEKVRIFSARAEGLEEGLVTGSSCSHVQQGGVVA